MLQSASSLRFVGAYLEGGELWLCEPDAAFPTGRDPSGLASALALRSSIWKDLWYFLHWTLLVLKVANVWVGILRTVDS